MWIRDPWLTVLKITAILSVAVVVMIISNGETAMVPLRLWLLGYGVLCINNSILNYIQLRSWRNGKFIQTSRVDCMESVLSGLNLIWWITGSYWMYSGGKMMANDAPKLFWLTAILLAFDLFAGAFIAFIISTVVVILLCSCRHEDEAIIDVIIRLLEIFCKIVRLSRGTTSIPDGETREPVGNADPIYYYYYDDDTMPHRAAPAQDHADDAVGLSEYDLDEGEIRELLPRRRHSNRAGIDTHYART